MYCNRNVCFINDLKEYYHAIIIIYDITYFIQIWWKMYVHSIFLWKFASKGFDSSYKNFLTCLRIGEPRWSSQFAGIRPTQTHRSNHCTERQVEVSNQLCLEKINNSRQNKTIHYVNRQPYNTILFIKYFWDVKSNRVTKLTKIASRGAICTLINRRHELKSSITRSRCKYTMMSVTKTFVATIISLFCPPEGRRLHILSYETCNESTGG